MGLKKASQYLQWRFLEEDITAILIKIAIEIIFTFLIHLSETKKINNVDIIITFIKLDLSPIKKLKIMKNKIKKYSELWLNFFNLFFLKRIFVNFKDKTKDNTIK